MENPTIDGWFGGTPILAHPHIIPCLCAWIGPEALWHEEHDPAEDHNWQLATVATVAYDDSITSHRIWYRSTKNHLQPPTIKNMYSMYIFLWYLSPKKSTTFMLHLKETEENTVKKVDF